MTLKLWSISLGIQATTFASVGSVWLGKSSTFRIFFAELSTKSFSLLRHHFEPNYDLKNDIEYLNPGYSRLRVFRKSLTDKERREVIDEYFKGTLDEAL